MTVSARLLLKMTPYDVLFFERFTETRSGLFDGADKIFRHDKLGPGQPSGGMPPPWYGLLPALVAELPFLYYVRVRLINPDGKGCYQVLDRLHGSVVFAVHADHSIVVI